MNPRRPTEGDVSIPWMLTEHLLAEPRCMRHWFLTFHDAASGDNEVHPGGMTAVWLANWRKVDEGEDAVFTALTSQAPWAVELRQNSPFAGVLRPEERQAALAAFRGHWRKAHAA